MCSESLLSSTVSTTFDRKLPLDIGRYNAGSLRSMVRFFSSGRDNGVLAAAWKPELLERRVTHCGDDWNQPEHDMTHA